MSRLLGSFSVRVQILTAVVGLAALVLAAAGYTAFAIQRGEVQERIDAELSADAEQFRVLLAEGVDPSTGEQFTSPSEGLRVAMSRIIPTRNAGVLGLVEGELRYTSPVSGLAVQQDEQLLDALAEASFTQRARVSTLETSTTTYRVAVVPVRSEDTDTTAEQSEPQNAAFVMAYDMDAEKRLFAEGFRVYALIAVVSLCVVGLVGWLLAGRLLLPVRVLASTARRLGREDISERIPVTGTDDLAVMTRSVNEMLERLESAFNAQDQLVQDVRHELRTPLTILRGHLEVLETDSAQEVASVRDLALDEIARMNRVVDDLTTLAQVEHPEFLRIEPVDLGGLTDEVYDKARGLGERRWLIESRAEADVVLDRERVTQAWLQLAANAVKFSAPGSEVSLGSFCSAEQIRLTVRDQGRGIVPEDQERIFSRFERADASVPGSGLGLPIVQAIARAHGGQVLVDSEVHQGTLFTVVLPRTSPQTPAPSSMKETP